MKKLEQLKNERGITLIVLVITVIVMIILAAIVINAAIGEGGLIGRAEDATNRHIEAENHELNVLNRIDSKYDQIANRIDGGNTGGNQPDTSTQPNPTKDPNPTVNPSPSPTMPTEERNIFENNSTINGGEPNAFNPEVPKGFKPVDIDDAVWGDGSTPPSEESEKKGLVIEDEEGNQFVWIAVDGINVKLRRYVFTETGEIDEELSKTEPTDKIMSSSVNDYFIEKLKGDTTTDTNAKDIEEFRASVEEHGGYYIARYEASYGIDEKPNSQVSNSKGVIRGGHHYYSATAGGRKSLISTDFNNYTFRTVLYLI